MFLETMFIEKQMEFDNRRCRERLACVYGGKHF